MAMRPGQPVVVPCYRVLTTDGPCSVQRFLLHFSLYASGRRQEKREGMDVMPGNRARKFSPLHKHLLLGLHGERILWVGDARALYFMGNGARSYDPSIQRFLSMDPYSPFSVGGMHPYAFCEGDPVNNIDPSGYAAQSTFYTAWRLFALVSGFLTLGLVIATMGGATAVIASVVLTLDLVRNITAIAADSLQHREPEAARTLKNISQGMGIAASIFGVFGGGTLGYAKLKGRVIHGLASGQRYYHYEKKMKDRKTEMFFFSEKFRDGSLVMTHGSQQRSLQSPTGELLKPYEWAQRLLRLPSYANSSQQGPLYLMSCHASKWGYGSNAAKISSALDRKVIVFDSPWTLTSQRMALQAPRIMSGSMPVGLAHFSFYGSTLGKPLRFVNGRAV